MSKAKENRMSREDAQAALKRGEHLAVGATVYRRGDRLPAPPPGPEGEEADTSVEAVVVRDADGHLTRAGMEHALRSGGSVMIGGEVITDADRLPSEEEWAAHREARQQAAADALDAQIASLQAQKKAKAGAAGGAQAWSPAPAPSGGKGTDASAATPEDFSVAGAAGPTAETAPRHGRAQHKRSE